MEICELCSPYNRKASLYQVFNTVMYCHLEVFLFLFDIDILFLLLPVIEHDFIVENYSINYAFQFIYSSNSSSSNNSERVTNREKNKKVNLDVVQNVGIKQFQECILYDPSKFCMLFQIVGESWTEFIDTNNGQSTLEVVVTKDNESFPKEWIEGLC